MVGQTSTSQFDALRHWLDERQLISYFKLLRKGGITLAELLDLKHDRLQQQAPSLSKVTIDKLLNCTRTFHEKRMSSHMGLDAISKVSVLVTSTWPICKVVSPHPRLKIDNLTISNLDKDLKKDAEIPKLEHEQNENLPPPNALPPTQSLPIETIPNPYGQLATKFSLYGLDYSVATFEDRVTAYRARSAKTATFNQMEQDIPNPRKTLKRKAPILEINHNTKRRSRSGRWTREEESYVKCLIEEFEAGLLPLTNGTMLRMFLASVLNCERMRVSKKFAGRGPKKHVTDSMGKHVFKLDKQRIRMLTDEDVMEKQKRLCELEAAFLQKVLETEHHGAASPVFSFNTSGRSMKDHRGVHTRSHGIRQRESSDDVHMDRTPRPLYIGWHTYDPRKIRCISFFGENRSERGGRKPKDKYPMLQLAYSISNNASQLNGHTYNSNPTFSEFAWQHPVFSDLQGVSLFHQKRDDENSSSRQNNLAVDASELRELLEGKADAEMILARHIPSSNGHAESDSDMVSGPENRREAVVGSWLTGGCAQSLTLAPVSCGHSIFGIGSDDRQDNNIEIDELLLSDLPLV